MNCLAYLLNLWADGHRFKIYSNSTHCFGMNEKKLFDLNGIFKKDFLDGIDSTYISLKTYYDLERVKTMFNLNERHSKLIDEYYASNN
jgi:hypothetical protein